ncbi:MAG TPA: preprotein translocase subunit YajC [Kiloniellales bacterium]|jgi:preprotein translocase subunit YajC|nr:preprotein translocase subunit YajC [Kiloniellales bacterium]
MLISPAYAQAPGAGGGDVLVSLLPIILIFVVFYFLLIRPQQKKVKQHRAMIEAVRRGDRIVTSGGIIGTVTKVISDGEVEVEIAQGTRVKVVRQTISDVLDKGESRTVAETSGAEK